MKLDYLIYYKDRLDSLNDWGRWDVFVSAYNDSERVKSVFKKVEATSKYWVILPEYCYDKAEYPRSGDVYVSTERNEADFIIDLFGRQIGDLTGKRLCVDITGFMRPHILFMLKFFSLNGVHIFEAIYSEPKMYQKKEATTFSAGDVIEVRQVAGFEGNHSDDMSNDLLLIGAGYDHDLIARISANKESARAVHICGLPSLSPDMYQENLFRLEKVGPRSLGTSVYFSSANDPFVSAGVLSEIVGETERLGGFSNLYLSPLSTKPQTLGFGLFFLRELPNKPASIIFPFARSYSRETSHGTGKIWRYQIEL